MFSRKPLDKTSNLWYNIYIKGKAGSRSERTAERENKNEAYK
nr:MAG TPA: hypothetical protein [Caudoviricetes sp.]